ncbi:general substrate transporter [Colletotrichum falcatum]|nr:general substrate transporter [Colletotrichum falcatum]
MGSKLYFGLTGNALSVLQIALVVCPAFILFGYNQAGLGGLITTEDWVKTFPQIDTVHTTGDTKKANSTLQGFVVATFTIGALFGSLFCSWAGNAFGRRNVIFFAGVCTLVGEILECASFHLAQLIIGRVIIGFGIGQLSSIVPVWQSETSGANNRGRQVVLTGLFTCVGYVLESWINLGFWEFKTGPVTWRPPIALAIAFSLVMMGSIYLLPESPRWLVMKGRSEEARAIISAFRGLPEDSLEVMAEVAGIEHSLEETGQNTPKLTDMLKMGNDKLASKALAGGALTWKFLSSFLAFFAIDRFGRRAVFIVSGVGMCACMTCLAITTSFPKDNLAAQIAAGCFIYLYNTFVPIGFLGANFLYCTEIAPLRLRMAMSSISTANHWLWNFIVVMVTPVALNTIGWRYYIVYAAVAACIPVSVYFLFPETMGRNLEEIELLFRDSPSVFATVRFAKNRPIAMPQEFESDKPGQKAECVEKTSDDSA